MRKRFWSSGSKAFFSKVEANQKCSLPKANQNCFPKAKADQNRFSTRWQRIKCVFRRVVIFSKRNWAGSKAFSHASASCDYMSLPILAGSKVGTPCNYYLVYQNYITTRAFVESLKIISRSKMFRLATKVCPETHFSDLPTQIICRLSGLFQKWNMNILIG